MTKKSPEKYNSEILENLINNISPEQQKKTERKMMLAARISDAMERKCMKKGELAKALNKRPSEITKWLSGTHNFTAETLWEICDVLGIDLINLKEEKKEQIIYVATISATQRIDSPVHFGISQEYLGYAAGIKSKQILHN